EMNLVLIGSLVAASRSDSRATASVTPSTSKSTLAGRITATQDSNGPLPLPIRVSSGFLVKDFCGKTRIHILPCRFILRAIATRAASSCLVSNQQRCSAIKPYSPKATVCPRDARPARLPRCIFRSLTLSGSRGISKYSVLGIGWVRGGLGGGDGFGLGLGCLGLLDLGLAFTDPTLNPQFSVDGVGFGKAVIDLGTQGMQ